MEHPVLTVDLKPSFSALELAEKIQHGKGELVPRAVKAWKLSKAAGILLQSLALPTLLNHPFSLAEFAKALPIPLTGPRPIAEAISSAGGICFSELNDDLMINRLPGLFVAGEMIDWEAPTGGYLLQGAFSTGTRAARGGLGYLKI
jgi:predicted flavoprotein YhiN